MKILSKFFSILTLLITNSIPLVGVLYYQWNVFSLMIAYWLENAVIGVFTVLKMQKARGGMIGESVYQMKVNGELVTPDTSKMGSGAQAFFIPFFMMHFGMFTAVHGIFVIAFFFSPDASFLGILLTFLSMIFSHYVSYQMNYLGKAEYLTTSVGKLFVIPYPRVIVMHLVVILGGMLAMNHQTTAALVLLVALRTLADVGGHMFEHRFLSKGAQKLLDDHHGIGELTYQSENFKG